MLCKNNPGLVCLCVFLKKSVCNFEMSIRQLEIQVGL